MGKVFVVLEDWKIDSGESGIYNSVFSTFEKAFEYYSHLKRRYEIDYELESIDKEDYNVDEDINVIDKIDII